MKKLTTIITTIILLTSITIAQNYSLSFDGEDDYVYRDDAVFDADGDWTISGWITTISDSSPQYIFSTSWSGNHNQNTIGILIVGGKRVGAAGYRYICTPGSSIIKCKIISITG